MSAMTDALIAAGIDPDPRNNPHFDRFWQMRRRPLRITRGAVGRPAMLSDSDVRAIRACRRIGMTYRAIAAEFEISESHARGICTGERRQSVTDERTAA